MSGFGLALGGGGARGLAHIGVLRVLAREDLTPDLIAGTSMGGLVGAFAAAGYTPAEIERAAHSVSWRSLLELRPGSGLLRASAFEAFLSAHLPATFEGLPTPLVVTATDVLSGRLVYLHRGPLYPALRATTAYPGAVDPVALGGQLLADGGILNQVPTDAALFLGARKILAVDVTAPAPLSVRSRRRFLLWQRRGAQGEAAVTALSPVRALMRALDIMQAQLTDARLSLYRPDVLLTPHLEGIELTSFRRLAQAIEAGEASAVAELGRLRALVGLPRVSGNAASSRGADMLPRDKGDS